MPRRGRRGRPGLVGTMARTAVISGTATAVSGNVARRQHQRAMAPQQAAPQAAPQQATPAPAPPPPPAPAPAPAAAPQDDPIAKLGELANLKAQGLLTEEEFSAAKAKLLGL
jgi:hypothetical protein